MNQILYINSSAYSNTSLTLAQQTTNMLPHNQTMLSDATVEVI